MTFLFCIVTSRSIVCSQLPRVKMATNTALPVGGTFRSESLRKMVYPRVFSTPVVIGQMIYVVGGCDQMGQPVDSFEVYDVVKNKWTTLQNMPTKRAAPAVGNKKLSNIHVAYNNCFLKTTLTLIINNIAV